MKRLFKIIFLVITFIFACLSFHSILKLGVLPNQYVWLAGGILLFLFLLIFVIFSVRKTVFFIIGIILSVLFLIGNGVGLYYLHETDYFLDKAFSGIVVEKTNYYVITQKDNNDELEDHSSIVHYDKLYQKKEILDLLNENYQFNFVPYESMNDMLEDLLNQKEKYGLIEETSYHILEKFDTRVDENLKVIKTFSIEKEKKTKAINEQSMNIYLLGNDFVGLNDFNMIVTVNPAKKKILLTTMTRDMRIPVYGYDGIEDNLEYMAPLGIDTSIHSLEDYFDLKIDYYVRINVDSVVEIINAVDGITFCSDYDYWTTTANSHNRNGKKFHVVKGCQELDGYQALAVARERKKIPGSDFARQDNMRKIMLAFLQKLRSTNAFANYQNLLDAVADSYETTIPRSVIEKFGQEILQKDSKWVIEENSISGEEVIGLVHLGTYRDYTVIPDLNSVQEAKDKIRNLGRD